MIAQDETTGIEIETIGRDRRAVAEAIQTVVGGSIYGSGQGEVQVCQDDGRSWKVVSDGSLTDVSERLRAEVVSPILTYSEMDRLQEVSRAVRASGARVSEQCGIHIHLSASKFDVNTIANLIFLVWRHEHYIHRALEIQDDRIVRFCKPINPVFAGSLFKDRPTEMVDLNSLWYGRYNPEPSHYDSTRYYGVNLHNIWYRGTIEFRWFEGTLHAGKIKAYMQLALSLGQKARDMKKPNAVRKVIEDDSVSIKKSWQAFLNNLGMKGAEFETAQKHLMENMG